MVWLPTDRARVYGPLRSMCAIAFGPVTPTDRVPLLLHPQPPASHRRVRDELGSAFLGDLRATPTSSFRSVMAHGGDREPVVLKLSLGAVVGRTRRAVDEKQVACAVLMTRMLEAISQTTRTRIGIDWFGEPAGMVDARGGEGWLLRELPRTLTETDGGELIPAFSLIARSGDRDPRLVDLIRQDGGRPEDVVVEQVLEPYVRVVSHLLLVEGIQIEGHTQNVLFEWGADDRPTGRVVLRDLGDMSVSIPLRLARRRPLPELGADLASPRGFALGSVASDHKGLDGRTRMTRAHDTIIGYGLLAFVWSINQSLARFFPRYDAERVERRYLELWRDAIMGRFPVRISVDTGALAMATDEAFEHTLRRIDWPSLGSVGGVSLPTGAEPLLLGGRARRRSLPVYDRLDCAWGELYIDAGLPAFFRPAR